MKAAGDYQFKTSQKDLAAGILKQAGLDLRRFHDATRPVERELYLDAYRWVTTDDCSWPFSFLNVCQLLHLAPEVVRQELLADAWAGFFTYWSQRCARAARSFQIFLSRVLTTKRNATVINPVPLTDVPIT